MTKSILSKIKISSEIRLMFVLLSFAALMFGIGGKDSQASFTVDQTIVGPGVEDMILTRGRAFIVLALKHSAVSEIRTIPINQHIAEIAALQNSVLSAVDPNAFELTHQFQAVPALAGNILSVEALRKIAQLPEVKKIDLDSGGSGHLAQSVPLIGANAQHGLGYTGAGVVVAVLDSGLDTDHSDLGDNLTHQDCYLDNGGSINGVGLCPNGSDRQTGPGSAEDGAGHGTHTTGIITAKGVLTSVGVAPDADIVAIKVLDNSSFSGSFYFFTEIVAALDHVVTSHPEVKVINMSLGTSALFAGNCDSSTSWNMAGAAAINTLRSNGVIAFASAGNNGNDTMMTSPACLSNVVSVGATDKSDVVASFTNSNSVTDIFGPGVSILSAGLNNTTTTASGTSMSSPHAAGCAALFIQSGEATTPDQIEARLESSTIQVTNPDNGLTFPRIDCSPLPTPTETASPTATTTPTPTDTTVPEPTITVTPSKTPIPTGEVYLPIVLNPEATPTP